VRPLLGAFEIEYFQNYDELVGDYMKTFNMDLTADLTPPKDLFIEVRVLQDCGEILLDTGSVNLEVYMATPG
jgi:GINS complex subunit 1